MNKDTTKEDRELIHAYEHAKPYGDISIATYMVDELMAASRREERRKVIEECVEAVKELQFECRKCGHQLFIDEKPGWVEKLTRDYDENGEVAGCPECGEENFGNWRLVGYGNFKEYSIKNS